MRKDISPEMYNYNKFPGPQFVALSDRVKSDDIELLILANEKDAVKMLNKRAKAKDFQVALTEARNDANAASEDDNRQICDDVRNYYSK